MMVMSAVLAPTMMVVQTVISCYANVGIDPFGTVAKLFTGNVAKL
jgi:hypothetical protein